MKSEIKDMTVAELVKMLLQIPNQNMLVGDAIAEFKNDKVAFDEDPLIKKSEAWSRFYGVG